MYLCEKLFYTPNMNSGKTIDSIFLYNTILVFFIKTSIKKKCIIKIDMIV
jgi:hypothetical protein